MLTSDYDGDFDIDASDAIFGACVPPPVGNCRCLALDFDEDGDIDWVDFNAFYAMWTGPLEDCIDCPLGNGDSLGGWSEEDVAEMPAGCELAAWYATIAPAEYVQPFVEYLADYVTTHPDADDTAEIEQFLACLYGVIE